MRLGANLPDGTARARVCLRSPTKQDFPELAIMRRDRELQHMLLAYPSVEQPSDSDIAAWVVRRTSERGGCFLVVSGDDHSFIGHVQIVDVHARGRHGKFGIAIRSERRGQGYGRPIIELLCNHASTVLGLFKLILETRPDNQSAIRLFENSGFYHIGVYRQHYHDGLKRHDVLLMERILDAQTT
jgi:RimJ/RimL family protein N-acetyltransferase